MPNEYVAAVWVGTFVLPLANVDGLSCENVAGGVPDRPFYYFLALKSVSNLS